MTAGGSDGDPIRRRDVLRGVAALGTAAGVAGCGSKTPGSGDVPPPEDRTSSSPTVYAGILSSEEVAAITQQVTAGNEPWSTAYDAQLRDAKRALTATPVSVVDDGSPDGVDEHRFATGEDRPDYHAAIDMGTWVRDLGIGYAFTGRERFAERAIELLDHWFLAPETRMYPSGRNFGEAYFSIELHITIPTLLYGAALVRDASHWSTVEADRGGAPRVGRDVPGGPRGRRRATAVHRGRPEQHLRLVDPRPGDRGGVSRRPRRAGARVRRLA
ncbi:hypothetical protein GJ633_01795 [Halorubrum sp. CBA1125]|nr:hypothetical protein [Halorubrum sp. CBA1125]